ncbi:MAG: thioredoxin domain-containing protein [Planctomycetota bacterium]|nr:MAG: thioredoxin domain-containing protein [Planctomycetota bacterium]
MNAPSRTNRLAGETSPYLLGHQHNPVDWYPWGEEALARARAEDKPILLSVGYSSCHWCHVMERECFEDEGIAALMNEHFVCVKVDREERPDIDAVYMQATLALRGHGGWPMHVFLTPDLEPFYAGTYFPPTDRAGLPGWPRVLSTLAEVWRDRRADVLRDARHLTDHLREQAAASAPSEVAAGPLLARAVEQLEREFDPTHGGFGPAPKFPRTETLELLLRHHARTGSERSLDMLVRTLDGMARGGIYDHLAGGFARYSTDSRWLVPHFEKMLYDNALLARVYTLAWQATGLERHARVARETLDYLLRELALPEGGFASATDADSEGEEGKFFVWTPAEVRAALGDEELARRFCLAYDVHEGGNWEGRSVLHRPRPLDELAVELGLSSEELDDSLRSAREVLYRARQERVPPALDDKLLTGWNALAISALALAARAYGEGRYLDAARRAADFLLTRLIDERGKLLRSFRAGRARFAATLEDYSALADGLVDLYEVAGERRYLAAATVLAEQILEGFAPSEGGAFYFTRADQTELPIRHREGHDGALPNPSALAARALARLSWHLDLPALRDAARKAILAYGGALERAPRAFGTSLCVLDFLDRGPLEVALVGDPADEGLGRFREEVGRRYLPDLVLAQGPEEDPGLGDPEPLPLLAGRKQLSGRATAVVCHEGTCRPPLTDPTALGALLDELTAPRP